jgi:AraC-like DNA-binding protein
VSEHTLTLAGDRLRVNAALERRMSMGADTMPTALFSHPIAKINLFNLLKSCEIHSHLPTNTTMPPPRNPFMPGLLSPEALQYRGLWRYWRPTERGAVELGLVLGHDVALRPHFHDEDQVTFVLYGRRQFVLGGRPMEVAAGHGIHIPAGMPHRSLSGPGGVVGINIYLESGAFAVPDLIAELSARRWATRDIHRAELEQAVQSFRLPVPSASRPMPGSDDWDSVTQAARQAGMSREGFSRRFRRLHGMPPQAFQLTEKLNRARRLLRAGADIAAVAADTGFADQSHLGRWFRRSFGITPGRYRLG